MTSRLQVESELRSLHDALISKSRDGLLPESVTLSGAQVLQLLDVLDELQSRIELYRSAFGHVPAPLFR